MKTAILSRIETGPEGTFGDLVVGEFKCATIELPWKNNAKNKSCIPAGTYTFRWRIDSVKHGPCYEADPDAEAPDRDNIQIHPANLAGDTDLGYVSQLEGCIAPGLSIVTFRAGMKPAGEKDQRGVSASKTATADLVRELGKDPFVLHIFWAAGVGQA